ncbi:hypothetical protein DVH05_022498 [Phytophthora capsici]|nr:hypothetical protein DVH05_022498 [Phytophthora capsici]|eukprot:jgi/Phyca11/14570/fgenesh1_pg.PHYCAscaffold_8_\
MPHYTRWTPDEVGWLVQAWQETKTEVKNSGVKKNLEEFHQLVHENFMKLAGGSSSRSVSAIRRQMNILKDSYEFIVSFQGRGQENGWFMLSTNDQRTLMQTNGGNQVRPIDEKVFSALDKFLADEESESEDSDGEKFEIAVKKRVAPKKKAARKSTSVLEEESGELLTPTKEEKTKEKRRRLTKSSVAVADILDRQSQVLAGFLEKRADERTHELEQTRKERESDQKFWAAETAKDRALLRDLFTQD